MSLVELHGLSKHFQRGAETIAVFDGLDLDLGEGSFTALMGPSGSGKSTLLNLVAGLDRPTGGTVSVGGADVGAMSAAEMGGWRARHIGFVFQSYNLLPVLTARQNVELPLLLTRLSRAERREHVETARGVVGLGDRGEHFPRQLSGGQEQRAAIARAIVSDPTIILLDEPTGQLDAGSAAEIFALLRPVNRGCATTILLVTHGPPPAGAAAPVLHLDEGVLRAAWSSCRSCGPTARRTSAAPCSRR